MGKPQRKKRTHKNIKDFKKKCRTRKKTKDLDEIHDDMIPKRTEQLLHQKIDPDLPGEGQFYCLFCARYFMSEKTLTEHKKTKNHKKRVRLLKDKPYTQAEAELAAGMGSYTIKPNIPHINIDKSGNVTKLEDTSFPSTKQTLTNTATVMEGLSIET